MQDDISNAFRNKLPNLQKKRNTKTIFEDVLRDHFHLVLSFTFGKNFHGKGLLLIIVFVMQIKNFTVKSITCVLGHERASHFCFYHVVLLLPVARLDMGIPGATCPGRTTVSRSRWVRMSRGKHTATEPERV